MFLSCIRPYSLNLPSMPSCVYHKLTTTHGWAEERGKVRASSNTSLLIRSEQVADLLHQSLLHQNTHKVVFPEKLVQCELRRREDIIEFVLDSPFEKTVSMPLKSLVLHRLWTEKSLQSRKWKVKENISKVKNETKRIQCIFFITINTQQNIRERQ